MTKPYFLIALLLLCMNRSSLAQCSFTATITTTESRCKENGSITVNVIPAGSYTYEIISGPELSALSSSNVFTGLGAGNYIVTIHGGGCDLNLFATVAGNYTDPGLLTAATTKIICPGGTACITADQPSNGRPPYTYSIISGPMLRAAQSSPAFCGLTEGIYNVQALDSCGVVRTSSFSIGVDTGDFFCYEHGWDFRYANCNDLVIRTNKQYTNTSSHTLLKLWFVNPDGDTLKVNDFSAVEQDMDTLPGMAKKYGTWQLLLYDECGRRRTGSFQYNPPSNHVVSFNPQCNGVPTVVQYPWRFGVGAGVIVRRCSDGSLVHSEHLTANNTTDWSAQLILDYDSCFTIETYNDCGDTIRSTYTTISRGFELLAYPATSCNKIGKSEIAVFLNDFARGVRPITFTITAGPASVGSSVQLTDAWLDKVIFENLTPGAYTIVGEDACGYKDTIMTSVIGLSRSIDILQTPHCSGGSNLHIKVTSNHMDRFYSDRYGAYEWLLTRVDYTVPNYPRYNESSAVTDQSTYEGFWEADYYDIKDDSLQLFLLNVTAMNSIGCYFDTTIKINKYAPPTLQNVSGYVCTSTGKATINYTVKDGVAPFRYRIKPDASATWSAWQDSSIFSGITAGTYDINVEDACPNGSIRSVNFTQWQKSPIAASTPCATINSPVTLRAETPVNFVSYQWVFNNVVVGTGSTYTIPSFNSSHEGTYKLRQVFRGGTCTDSTSILLLTCSVLPLTFGEFAGEFQNDLVRLEWSTLTDVPGSRFIIERSLDGANFSKIGEVSNLRQFEGSTYRFIDNRPGNKNFYRIGFFTDPGSVYYSNVIKLVKNQQPDEQAQITISPVPFKNKFQVQINSKQNTSLSVKLFDVQGKKIIERKVNVSVGNNIILFSDEVSELNTGYYFVEITGDELLQRKKIMKE